MTVKVCFVTLSRSDYTSLRPVIRAAKQDPDIEVVVVAGGSHLCARFGKSIEDIQSDQIHVDKVVGFLDELDDSEHDIAKAYGRAYQAFVEYFSETPFDSVFILGDRWEMLAVATAASFLRIPIVHHSGGDITQGSLDNQTRYALSVLSHLHLVALDEHRDRLIAMGEEPWRVVSVGEPSLTEIKDKVGSVKDVRAKLGFAPDAAYVLATFHPTTFDEVSFEDQARLFIETLELIDHEILLTASNPDPGSRAFFDVFNQYAKARENVHLFENLGPDLYFSAMNEAEFMIGNSSSGLWEAPSLGLPVINMGERQKDRLRGENVIDVKLELDEVKVALDKIEDVRRNPIVQKRENPYVKENTLALILGSIKTSVARKQLLAKKLVDPLVGI